MVILSWQWFYVENSLFCAVKVIKNVDHGKYSYFGCGISFDVLWTFSLPNSGFGKNVIIFGADMSSSVHVDYKKDDSILLDDSILRSWIL